MNLEEYREWLREHGNLEEANALGVLDVIVRHHTAGTNLELKEVHPHVWLNGNNEKLEFDLLIILRNRKGHVRRIGVEFKEGDVKKVLAQAIARQPYVDYMYIATRSWVTLDFEDLFVMGYYGIGWVVWEEGFAKMIVSAKYHSPASSLEYMIERAVKIKVEEEFSKLFPRKKDLNLEVWLGGVRV
ncbi:hypothetical protein [Pyrococcus kukulkanii]|uniref:hypothetical protein n=1 Tax=Pyrococcus kukulkanii TaxID=1609559 RepID=UPI003567AE28